MVAFEKYFDPEKPTVREIKEKHGSRIRDYSTHKGMSGRDVADAIASLPHDYALILPLPENKDNYYDAGAVFCKGKKQIPLDTPSRFKKFGPEINIIGYKTAMKDIRENKLTIKKAFRQAFASSETKERLLSYLHRGFGWWDVATKTHRIIPFDVPPEGQMYFDLYKKKMSIDYQLADSFASIPSFSKEEKYKTKIWVLPVTDEYLIEWTKMTWDCNCEDSMFKEARSKIKIGDEYDIIFKYSNSETPMCRHIWANILKSEEHSKTDNKPFRIEYLKPKGDMRKHWGTIKTRLILAKADPGGKIRHMRRPLKAETSPLCGYVMGYCGIGELYDLDE